MMTDPDRTIWRKTLAHLRAQRPELWRQWFEDIEPLTLAGGVFGLRVSHPVQLRYLQRECARAIGEAAQAITGRLVSVRFEGPEAAERDGAARELAVATEEGREERAPTWGEEPVGGFEGTSVPRAQARRERSDELVLVPDYTFENFVVGPGNRLAHAAAIAIGENPGRAYNPMFIHGGVGLGKTHLLQAVCQRVLQKKPDALILYISCENFVTRFMDAVQAGQMAGFRHHFRDVDMLVIDDIHFLAGRDRTQEEFFHTFNSLYQSSRQIILSSDAPPDEIPDLEDRLVSRFKWGLVVNIEPPDFETRVAIVKQKARVRGVTLPDDVASLIAQRFQANIRELEGALTKVQMQSMVEVEPGPDGSRTISLELARKALGVGSEPASGARPTIETIVTAVTSFYDVSLSALQSKRRQRSIALPRQVCMYLARRYTRYSLEEIGGYFGGRDHTTVLHAVNVIKEQRDADLELGRTLQELESKLGTPRA